MRLIHHADDRLFSRRTGGFRLLHKGHQKLRVGRECIGDVPEELRSLSPYISVLSFSSCRSLWLWIWPEESFVGVIQVEARRLEDLSQLAPHRSLLSVLRIPCSNADVDSSCLTVRFYKETSCGRVERVAKVPRVVPKRGEEKEHHDGDHRKESPLVSIPCHF